MELEFDPDSVFATGTKIRDAATDVHEWVTAPLHRVSLPQMPAPVRGEVEGTLARVVAMVTDAQRTVIQVGQELRNKTYEMTDLDNVDALELPWWTAPGKAVVAGAERFGIGGDDATRLPWWTVPGDIMVAGAKFTGTDVIYRYNEAKSGRGGEGAVKESGINFALTLVGGKLIKGAWKGGKWVVAGARGTRGAAVPADVAAQLARLNRYDGVAMKTANPRHPRQLEEIAATTGTHSARDMNAIRRHIANFELRMGKGPMAQGLTEKSPGVWAWKKFRPESWYHMGGHLRQSLGSNHWIVAVGREDASGVRWVKVAHRGLASTPTWKSMFPRHWTTNDVAAAAAKFPQPGKHVGEHNGVPFTIIRDAKGNLDSIFPNAQHPHP